MKKYYIKYGDFIYCVKNRKVRVVKDISELNDWGTPCDLTDKMPFEDILKYIKEFIDVVDKLIILYILDQLRRIGPFPKAEELDRLLPWSKELPEELRTNR